jgi:hypothetical protein
LRQYRKKPVVIEAAIFSGELENAEQIIQWSNNEVSMSEDGILDRLVIKTLEGEMTASVGDYIIRGVNGEFYPCKPDIFSKTYEEVQ